MNIALLGYGKMGRLIEQMALERGHKVVSRISAQNADWDAVQEADVCIDFSASEAVIGNLEKAAQMGKNVVIGTTGWQGRLDAARAIVETCGTGALFAPNFSLGVHLFLQIVERAAELIDHFEEYGVAGHEIHHSQKKDAPSGTALELCRRIKQKIRRVDKMDMAAVRVGSVPGTHTVVFDSPYDTITLTHTARSRGGFAKGAVEAAEWLAGKTGFFGLEDFYDVS